MKDENILKEEKNLNEKTILDSIESKDLAIQLEEYTDEQINELCLKLNTETLAKILEESEETIQIKIIGFLENIKILEIFNDMSKDDIVDILGQIPIARSKELINLMKEGEQKIINQLLGYKDDSAGGIMTTEYITLNKKLTIDEAIKKIKEIVPKTEVIETIFVIDDDNKLIGKIELRDILITPENEIIENIVEKNFVYVEPEEDQEEVALIASKYDLNVIPVVNRKGVMIGIITIDDIIDVIVEEQTEDVLKMGGVSREERLDSSLSESIKLRLPWLFVNLLTAFLAALTVRAFESTIEQVVALSATMSMVTGMGGNAGTQTISIIIRNIAIGKVELKEGIHLLKKELMLGFINGAMIGIVTGIIVAVIYSNMYLGLIILLAMIGNLIVSGFFGILVPLILDKLNIDPALSSTIFLTTATDVLGFFIFLGLAQLFLQYLV